MKVLNRTLVMLAGGMLALPGVGSDARSATTLPRETVMAMVAEEAEAHGVPTDLALAVAEAESDFATLAISERGARGVMQMTPRTARMLYGLKPYQLFDARTNIRAGVAYLGSLIERYGHEDLALSHYNGGSGVRRADGGFGVIPATRRYVDRVLSRRRHYASMDAGGHDALHMDGVPSLRGGRRRNESWPASTGNAGGSWKLCGFWRRRTSAVRSGCRVRWRRMQTTGILPPLLFSWRRISDPGQGFGTGCPVADPNAASESCRKTRTAWIIGRPRQGARRDVHQGVDQCTHTCWAPPTRR